MNLTKAPLRTLFLDAGGVLVNPNWDRVADAMNRHGVPITGDALRAAEPHAKKEMDVPSPIPVSDQKRGWVYFNLVLGQAGVQPADGVYKALDELRTYHRTENLWESAPADAKESLQRLRDSGLKLVVVSNANGTVKHLFGRLGLAPYFDLILDSQEEGIEKPDPRFFRIAMDKSGADPNSTLHVGDLYHVDVVGARNASLPAILFDVAGLYPDADCPRVASLTNLADLFL
jgi:HAD superfamily hydrolase (TIGR01549 family)